LTGRRALWSNHGVSDPAAPRPSSTIVLLREERGEEGPFSVLLLERHGSIAFPGAHAFPGGVVDPGDEQLGAAALPATQCWADAPDGDCPPGALRYWMAGARELFEEVGILLARRNGRLVEGPLTPALARLRAEVLAGAPFAPALAAKGLVPATDALYYFARWITPRMSPRRWDTRFLVGEVPPGAEIAVDGTETVSAAWLTPRAALAAYEAGRIELIPPTVRTLDDLSRFSSVAAVLRDAAERVVRALTPEPSHEDGQVALAYPDNTGRAAGPPRRLVLRDGRWRPESD
jgi:8-oxo-dGTP pyrophosphatase MutT (NUDIX family)